MSKGLSRIQNCIIGLLRGTVRRRCFPGSGGALITSELAEELMEHGLLSDHAPRKQQLFIVRRACDSLIRRGLIVGEYTRDGEVNRVVSWSKIESSADSFAAEAVGDKVGNQGEFAKV